MTHDSFVEENEAKAQKERELIAWQFVRDTPLYHSCPENAQALLSYLNDNEWEISVEGLKKAFADLRKLGKLKLSGPITVWPKTPPMSSWKAGKFFGNGSSDAINSPKISLLPLRADPIKIAPDNKDVIKSIPIALERKVRRFKDE